METDMVKIKKWMNFWKFITKYLVVIKITTVSITIFIYLKTTSKILIAIDVILFGLIVYSLITYMGWRTQLENLEEQKFKEVKGIPGYLNDEE